MNHTVITEFVLLGLSDDPELQINYSEKPICQSEKKAFSTCSSHMIVISISYGGCIFMYADPSAREKASLTKGVAILNASVARMLNPLIYTLRNQQVKQAFRDMVYKAAFSANK
ncbi:unnamed protein product [Rangifer tarandus platyrhynchus]|uniref:Uncharacterized protein n=1 Tax=Rangifer tarandus platyrhynchus TaxID=3082113 RepID=A0AC59ZCQ3_RANTA